MTSLISTDSFEPLKFLARSTREADLIDRKVGKEEDTSLGDLLAIESEPLDTQLVNHFMSKDIEMAFSQPRSKFITRSTTRRKLISIKIFNLIDIT